MSKDQAQAPHGSSAPPSPDVGSVEGSRFLPHPLPLPHSYPPPGCALPGSLAKVAQGVLVIFRSKEPS